MDKSTEQIQNDQAVTSGLFELGSLLDELNRRYKVVKTPTKEDAEKG